MGKRFRTAGFTLIELIIVIVIIGILAGIAIPRFINQTKNARIAALNGMASAINSAVMLAQAEYKAEATNTSPIVMDGINVTVLTGATTGGFPTGDAPGINTALRTVQGFTPSYSGGVATYDFTTAITNCNLTYTQSTGTVLVTNTGC